MADAFIDIATTTQERSEYQSERDKALASDRVDKDRETEVDSTADLLQLGLNALQSTTEAKRRRRAVSYTPIFEGKQLGCYLHVSCSSSVVKMLITKDIAVH